MQDKGLKTLESMSQAIWYNQWTLSKFSKFIKGDILEVGCGIGNFTSSLIKFGRVWAIDINPNYIKETQRHIDDRGDVGYGDIEKGKYFFKDKLFDTVICLNVLEHIKDDKQALLNLTRLVKAGGYLILLVPAYPSLYGEIDKAIDHFRRYNRNKIVELIEENKLDVKLIRTINFLGALGWWFTGKILKKKIVEKDKLQIFNLLSPFVLTLEDVIEPPFGTSILIVAQRNQS